MGVQFTPPPPAAVSRILSAFDREQLSGFIAVAIDLLDLADGDTDIEPNGDDLGDQAYPDAPAARQLVITGRVTGLEDAEDDDEAEEDDEPEDDDSDRCAAGEDIMIAGPASAREWWEPKWHAAAAQIGDDDDAEANEPPAYRLDQRRPLFLHAENDA